jgi:hypothetical protein
MLVFNNIISWILIWLKQLCLNPSLELFFWIVKLSNSELTIFYIIKEFVQPKMSLNREFHIWKERGGGGGVREREGWVGGQADQQAVIFKARLGLGEMQGRNRDRET